MKIPNRRRAGAALGFSLMELLVVVALIVILAGLTIAGMSFVNTKVANEKAKVQMNLLASAIQEYYSDNRAYPTSTDATGAQGSEILYKALYQDGIDAKASGTSGVKIYLGDLDPSTNKEGNKGGQNWIRAKAGGSTAQIVDPWGNPWLYRSGKDARNPDYDLWSKGKDGKTNTSPDIDPKKDKDTKDDISNFK